MIVSKKLSKNNCHKDARGTLHFEHLKKLKSFETYYATLPLKQERLKDIEKLEKGTSLQRREMMVLKEEKDDLCCEIHKIISREDENNYLLKAMKFLTKEHLTKPGKDTEGEDTSMNGYITHSKSDNKGEKYNRYMEECHETIYDDTGIEAGVNFDTCEVCNIPTFVDTRLAEAICPNCGLAKSYQDSIGTPEYLDTVQILSPFAYKRINHLREYLTQLQAKQTTHIPTELRDALIKELRKERIESAEDITTARVRRYLKKLGKHKYYEHITIIICQLTGKKPPRLSKDLEEKILQMFSEIQQPFERHCPSDRKNFLSYSYTIHKLCLILDKSELCVHFPLLKSRDKNFCQDQIWKRICQDLNWPFHASV
uniref:Viral late gene transcription factor 3 zinc ribbon domain-containing protein n=1 Tax=viral metagenome TaxID=1070528 RepID=A0A6C0KEP1_9ZZZZ